MHPAPDSSLTRAQRLERLAPNGEHRRLVMASGVGWALDAMDVGLVSFVMAALAKQWHLTPTHTSWLASVGFVGMAIGAAVGGLLADRIGRRRVFAATLVGYGLATGASAFAGSLAVLLVLRFVVGLGLGAELPVASTLVSEFSPARVRGRMVVALESFWALGWLLAALVGYLVVPASHDGWRWAMAIGVAPALYALVVRRTVPESVRYLEATGEHERAEQVVRRFEAAGAVDPHWHPEQGGAERGDQTIWSAGLRQRTAALWVVWFCVNLAYYGAFIWIPSLLVAQGHTLVKSFGFTLVMTLAQLPGYALSAWLVEVWGRRATLAAFLLGSTAAALAYGQADGTTQVVVAGCLLSFANLGAWGALYAVGPELYPTQLRGTGTGAAAAFGRLASIIAPLLVPVLVARGGTGLAFGVLGGAFLVATLASLLLPEGRSRALGRV